MSVICWELFFVSNKPKDCQWDYCGGALLSFKLRSSKTLQNDPKFTISEWELRLPWSYRSDRAANHSGESPTLIQSLWNSESESTLWAADDGDCVLGIYLKNKKWSTHIIIAFANDHWFGGFCDCKRKAKVAESDQKTILSKRIRKVFEHRPNLWLSWTALRSSWRVADGDRGVRVVLLLPTQ